MLLVVVGVRCGWWNVSDGFEKVPVLEPVYVLEGGVLDLIEVDEGVPLDHRSPGSLECDAPTSNHYMCILKDLTRVSVIGASSRTVL